MAVIEFASLEDPRLTDYAHRTDVALRKAQGTEHGLYLAESALVLERALAAGHRPRSVLALRSALARAEELVGPEVPIFTGPDELLTSLTGYALHRGLIGSLHRPPLPVLAELLKPASTVVVIDHVVDPTNVGSIFRAVAGIGADAVLVTPETADPFYRRCIRVAMGTVLQVPWTRTPEWPELGGLLRASGFTVAAMALGEDAVDLRAFAAERPERLAIVLGTEGEGLSAQALAEAEVRIQIPMRHGVDSLNVATAAAVALWALVG